MRDGRGCALAIAVLLAVLTGCGGDATGEPQASTTSATPSPTPPFEVTTQPVPFEAGTYQIPRSAWSVVDYTVTFPEGWTVQAGASFHKHSDEPDEVAFEALVPDTIYADACEGSQGELMEVGPSVDDLAAALVKQRGPMASGPVDTTLGGYPAIRIDLTVPKGFDLHSCNVEGVGLQIWFSHPADGYFVLFPDAIASVYIVDVDGQRQVFQTQHGSATSDRDVRELQAVIDSIHIET